MQKEWWMRPALQTSEAVLLPALETQDSTSARSAASDFLPVKDKWETPPNLALSTYVRPRGSMAGRSVLRAAGIHADPYASPEASRFPPLLRAARGRLR